MKALYALKLFFFCLLSSQVSLAQTDFSQATVAQLEELQKTFQLRNTILNSVDLLVEGLPPGTNEEKKLAIGHYADSVHKSLSGPWMDEKLFSPQCHEFFVAQDKVRTDISERLEKLSRDHFEDEKRFFQSRLESLAVFQFSLDNYAAQDAEGGFDPILKEKIQCVQKNRQGWKDALKTEISTYKDTLATLFGKRGLKNVYEVSQTLSRNNLDSALFELHWGFPILVSSAVIPTVALEMVAFRLLAAEALTVRTAYTLRTLPMIAVGSVEGSELGRNINPGIILSVGDWEKVVRGAQEFAELKFDSPEVYILRSTEIEVNLAKDLRNESRKLQAVIQKVGGLEQARRINSDQLTEIEKILVSKSSGK